MVEKIHIDNDCRICNVEPTEELVYNLSELFKAFGDTNIIKAVRNIVGLDKSVVSDIFYKYINDNRLNMKQIQFVKLLVDYVIKNGTIDMQKLTEQPFKNVGEVYDLFGNNIDLFKKIREIEGLTIEQVADLAGIHRTSLGLIERNERQPTLGVAMKVANALNYELSDLLTRVELVANGNLKLEETIKNLFLSRNLFCFML